MKTFAFPRWIRWTAAAATACCAAAWAADATPIVIPVVPPLGGATSEIGQDSPRGAGTVRAAIERALEDRGGQFDRESMRQALRGLKIPGEATVPPFSSIEFDPQRWSIGARPLVAQ